jgi:ABC-2 type transport system permease protein
MSAVSRAIAAYPTLLRVGLAASVAYRAEMLVWMLTTTMPLVSLALWSAVAADAPVGGFTPRRFSAYFLATLVVRQLTGSWLVWALNYEIRHGSLSQKLLKPIHPLVTYTADNLSAIPLRAAFAAPIAIISLLVMDPGVFPATPGRLALLAAALVGAWAINFFTMALIGSLAFFMESTIAVFEVWLVVFALLSGYLVPLELFPPWIRGLAEALPFRYTLSFPVEVALGLIQGERALRALAVEWAYVAGFVTAALLVWRAGLRRYAAFGG